MSRLPRPDVCPAPDPFAEGVIQRASVVGAQDDEKGDMRGSQALEGRSADRALSRVDIRVYNDDGMTSRFWRVLRPYRQR